MNKSYFNALRPLLPTNLHNKVVLDLACNAGFVSFELAKLGAKVTAFDISETYIDQANLVMCRIEVPRVHFIIMDIEKLEPSFYLPDLILLLSCLYHLKDPKAMIKKVCNTSADVIASFRLNNYDKFISLFNQFGRTPSATANYGRKKAALFRKP